MSDPNTSYTVPREHCPACAGTGRVWALDIPCYLAAGYAPVEVLLGGVRYRAAEARCVKVLACTLCREHVAGD